MNDLAELAKKLCKKYYLEDDKIKIVIEKKIFHKKEYLIYGKNEYFFKKKDKDYYFFPYFINKECELESWIASISKTNEHHFKIVKNLEDGKHKRDDLKKKYKI